MNKPTMTTQKQVRAAFWEASAIRDFEHPGRGPNISHKRGRDGDFNTDTRCAFGDFVDMLARDGQISEKLAERVTL